MRNFLVLFAVILCAVAVPAQDLTTVLIQPAAPFTPGAQCRVTVCVLNNSTTVIEHAFSPGLDCTIVTTNGTSNAVLILDADSGADHARIAPNAFAKRDYLLSVRLAETSATLSVADMNPVTLAFQKNDAPPKPQEPPGPPGANPFGSQTNNRPVEQFLTRHLSTYEPIYFILGSYPAAEFQFSLKYQLFAFDNTNNFLENAADHFYFGFTQTSLWDLFSRDPSFYDTSYKPSLFFYYPNVLELPTNSHVFLDLQTGGEHESNGKGGTGERSIYTGYVQPTIDFKLPQNFDLSFQSRARGYFLVGQNNLDIADYRGYVDLLTSLTWIQPQDDGEKVQLALKYQIGQAGRHAGYKVDLRFNLAGVHFLSAFKPTIQLQYFDGYGQSFLQYNQSSRAYRAGLCLWFF